MTEVTLGDFTFPVDPTEPDDFRLNVEGASGTGKSNTLAVILEDLADVQMPTLVIERLGILSSVRQVDEDMVVVGGRDEEGIDLAVPIQSLEVVADMVLERGMKVLLDVATYDTDDPDEHGEHRATATVLKALNRMAQERLRSGRRRKALVVIDEVHVLAPERGAPHIDPTDDVKRAKGQIVNMATEGGNKGLSVIIAYQRRAYTTKGAVSQADNYVVHRLHSTDVDDAAGEIGVDGEAIQELGTGEAFVYGDWTKQRPVGPVTIRRRTSPDPREGQFELPDPPDQLSDTLEAISEQVAEVQEQRDRRQTRIDELESRNERLQDRLEDLEEQAHLRDLFQRALEEGEPGGEVEAVAAEVDDLQARLDQVQAERDDLEQRLDHLTDELDAKERTIEDLEAELSEYRDLDVVRDEVVDSARSILRQLGALDLGAEEARQELDELRDELTAKEDRIQELQERASQDGGDPLEPLDSYGEFLEDPAVLEAIEEAKSKQNARKKSVNGILAAILDENGPVTYTEIADRLGYSSTSHVSSSASALEAVKVVKKLEVNGDRAVDLNTDGLNEVRFAAKRRERTSELMEQFEG